MTAAEELRREGPTIKGGMKVAMKVIAKLNKVIYPEIQNTPNS